MCAISSLTSTFAISSPDEFLSLFLVKRCDGLTQCTPALSRDTRCVGAKVVVLGIQYRRYGWYRPSPRVGKVHIKQCGVLCGRCDL